MTKQKNSKKPICTKHNIQDMKRKLRTTPAWRQFRIDLEDYFDGNDPITLKPLRKGWNAHHMRMSLDTYDELVFGGSIGEEIGTSVENVYMDYFLPLNVQTHDVIHFCQRYAQTDPGFMARLTRYVEMMVTLNKK